MHLEKVNIAMNGFVLEDASGNLHIAKTLLEAAQLAGEAVPSGYATIYAVGFDVKDLASVKRYFREGRKIDAIKLLRDVFTPRLGLREAKDLVEQLCG